MGNIKTHLNVSIAEAANLLGVSQQFLRCGLRQGRFPFGTAVKMSSVYTYYINREQLMKYIGGKHG